MFTKTQIMEAYDKGVALSKGPVINKLGDEHGRVCALGAICLGETGCHNTGRVCCQLASMRSHTPSWVKEALKENPDALVYESDRLSLSLASVFNVTGSFSEARAWLDKELSRHVSLGNIKEE